MPMSWKIIVGVVLAVSLSRTPRCAAAPSNDFLNHPVMVEATIASRDPQARASSGNLDAFTPAPMPDLDRSAPTQRAAARGEARLAPRLFHKQTTYHGEGYVFGSTVQEEQDRRATPAPGINLVMPLQ